MYRNIQLMCEKGDHRWRKAKRKKHCHRNAKVVVLIKPHCSSLADSMQDVSNSVFVSMSRNVNTVQFYFTLQQSLALYNGCLVVLGIHIQKLTK